jgi:ribosomal protein S18 acetylase RimI-like enzyme
MFEFRPLQSCWGYLLVFWEDIQRLWIERGGTGDVTSLLQDKAFQAGLGKVEGHMAFFQGQPIGMYWVERVTPHYGNMVLHSLHSECRALLVSHIISQGLIKDMFSELIQFEEHDDFRTAFVAEGAYENARQRMGLDTALFQRTLEPRPGLSFTKMSPETTRVSSEISCAAHLVSQDYKGYVDLENVEKRIILEEKVFGGLYGPIIADASFALHKDGKIIGTCLVVDIKCWGYDHVPWIFDLCIDPPYHGQGYGRYLFEEVLAHLKELGYPIVGLAVTLTNAPAITLYKNLGFEVAEVFYEYSVQEKGVG